ncbi:hypothetical protein ES705_34987 [subsurface metagenome]
MYSNKLVLCIQIQVLNLCTSQGKNFIMFKEHELIQMLYIYEIQKEKKNVNN